MKKTSIMDVIEARRSARRFTGEPVPEEALRDILEAARLAPSGGNGQNWVFGVVTDGSLKRGLARAAGDQEWIAEAPVVIALCANVSRRLRDVSDDDFGMKVNQARFGHEFIGYLQSYADQRAVSLLMNNANPLIPGEHMCLAAESHGLSTCWIGYLDINEAGRVLGLPDELACLFLLPIGYRAEAPKPIERKDVSEIVFKDRWSCPGNLYEKEGNR